MDMVSSRTFDGRLQLLEYAPTVLAGPPGTSTDQAENGVLARALALAVSEGRMARSASCDAEPVVTIWSPPACR
jgi:hypothetical protein